MDGLHITALLLSLVHKYMRELITNGYLFSAVPPLYKVIYNKNQSLYLKDDKALQNWRSQHSSLTYEVQRFKGIGEMDVSQIRETVLDPTKRTLKRITINDALKAEEILKICMGTDAALRRKFIEENAYLIN